jgi:glycerophosphoryl diester phosphodiesterase
MLLIAHRGVPTQSTENTLRSILIAQRKQADGVEFDVRSTRDGVPVLLHDKTLQRLWGRADAIEAVDLEDVRRLAIRGPDGGTDRIPTFEEVLDGTTMMLVVDCKAPAAIPVMVDMVRAKDQVPRVKWIGEPEILAVVRPTMPEAEIVMSWSKPEPPPRTLLDTIRPFAVNLEWSERNAACAAALRAQGYPVWVYTVDEPGPARRARDAGAAAIISNDLDAIAPGLAEGT